MVAAAVDGNSMNGVAPGVSLVSLKIAQWCGSTYDSEIMAAFIWAADHGVDVVAVALGNYLDRAKPDQKQSTPVRLGREVRGGARHDVVASSGNEHTRIGRRQGAQPRDPQLPARR